MRKPPVTATPFTYRLARLSSTLRVSIAQRHCRVLATLAPASQAAGLASRGCVTGSPSRSARIGSLSIILHPQFRRSRQLTQSRASRVLACCGVRCARRVRAPSYRHRPLGGGRVGRTGYVPTDHCAPVVMVIHPHPFDPRTTYRCMLAERCQAPGRTRLGRGRVRSVRAVLESGAQARAVAGVVAVVAAGAGGLPGRRR